MAQFTERALKGIENRVRDDMAGSTWFDGPRDEDRDRETLELIETIRVAQAERDEAYSDVVAALRERDEAREQVKVLIAERDLAQQMIPELRKRVEYVKAERDEARAAFRKAQSK